MVSSGAWILWLYLSLSGPDIYPVQHWQKWAAFDSIEACKAAIKRSGVSKDALNQWLEKSQRVKPVPGTTDVERTIESDLLIDFSCWPDTVDPREWEDGLS